MKKILLAFLVLLLVVEAFAQQGVLDQSFGVGGKVVTSTDSFATTKKVLIQPDGKIISGSSTFINGISYLTLIRYNIDGSLDNSFGNNGIVNTHRGLTCELGDIALQPDGKILAGGSVNDTNNYSYQGFLLIRYLPNGTIDSTFGNNGTVKTFMPVNEFLSLTCILVKPDGKIVAGGKYSTNAFTEDPVVAQYLPNGKLDSSFNSVGITTVYFNLPHGKAKSVSDMVSTIDREIILTVEADIVPANDGSDYLIAKILPNGLLDNSFGTNGSNSTDLNNSIDLSYGITMLPDSSVVLAGSFWQSPFYLFAMVKYTSNGKVDSSFGINGRVTTRFIGKSASANKIIVDPSGKLVVCGQVYTGSMSSNAYDFALVMYNSNGSLDSSFGRNGMLTTDFGNNKDIANSCALQADGKIVLAGDSYNGQTTSIVLARYDRNSFLQYNSIDGIVFIDNNANGIKEANERFYSNAKILTKHNADSVITFTFNGSFSIETDTGLFVSKAIAPLNYYNIVPVSHTSVFSTYLNTDNVRFGLQPINGKRDLAIYVIPENTPRPGFPVRYRIFYKNQGTDTLTSGTIKLVKSNLCNFASASPLPANVVGDTLWWNISNLKPMDTASIYLQLTVLPPPTVNLNDVLNTSLSISIAGNEQTPNDNVDTIRQVVRNSYDPNDKAEIHGGKITALQIANGEYLQYIIRFQNTGNDTAFNVYIRDTLDNKLDWSTFGVIDASSNFQLSLKDGNKCQFTFPNIMLPDSNTNEPLSHGYLVYIIKPKTNLVVGNVIKNKAAIYFDYNLPVITNTEKTEVVAEVYPLKLVNFSARKSHSSYSLNGEGSSQVLLNWTTANEVNTDYFDIERSNSGKEFISIGKVKATANSPLTTFYSFTDKSPLATANYYRLKIVDKDGKFEYSPIRMIGIMGSFSIRIYPNPAKDKLQLQIDNYRKQTLQVEVISQDGKVVLSTNIYQTEGSILRSISTTQLQKGMYSVRVFSKATTVKSEDEQQILTFEKM